MRRSRVPALRGRNELRDVKLFVSSPGDVAPERGRVEAVVAKLNREYDGLARFETILWEEHFYKADSSFPAANPGSGRLRHRGVDLLDPHRHRAAARFRAHARRAALSLGHRLRAAHRARGAPRQSGVPDIYVFRKTADAALPTTDAERRRQAQTQLDALEAFWSEWFRSEKRAVQGGVPDLRRPRRLRGRSWKRCCGNGSRRRACSGRVSRGRRKKARRSAAWRRSRPSTRRCSSAAPAPSTRRAAGSSPPPSAARHSC